MGSGNSPALYSVVLFNPGFLAKSNPFTPPSTFQDRHLVCSWLDIPSEVWRTINTASVADSLHSPCASNCRMAFNITSQPLIDLGVVEIPHALTKFVESGPLERCWHGLPEAIRHRHQLEKTLPVKLENTLSVKLEYRLRLLIENLLKISFFSLSECGLGVSSILQINLKIKPIFRPRCSVPNLSHPSFFVFKTLSHQLLH